MSKTSEALRVHFLAQIVTASFHFYAVFISNCFRTYCIVRVAYLNELDPTRSFCILLSATQDFRYSQ